MCALWQKISISLAPDALVLRNLDQTTEDSSSVSIKYGTGTITTSPDHDINPSIHEISIEAHGIIGILNLVSSSYLLAIVGQQQVATIQSEAIYAVNDVIHIPLASLQEARKTVDLAKRSAKPDQKSKPSVDTDESDVEEGAEDGAVVSNANETSPQHQRPDNGHKAQTDLAKDSASSTGQYGRFAKRWFTKGTWNINKENEQKTDSVPNLSEQSEQEEQKTAASKVQRHDDSRQQSVGQDEAIRKDGQIKEDSTAASSKRIGSLANRINRNARLLFSSSEFYYSYQCNISRRIKDGDTQASKLPLWKRFDQAVSNSTLDSETYEFVAMLTELQYFWNQHLMTPFIEAGADQLILPLMQGFVGQRSFSILQTSNSEEDVVAEADDHVNPPETDRTEKDPSDSTNTEETHEFLVTLVSRRSTMRAGLRYTRRGVDDDGNVANAVESEQILSSKSSKLPEKIFALVQVRGSIPLHFSQSPYSLKPTPTMYGSERSNEAAMAKHFKALSQRYGTVQVVSLVDKRPPEMILGEQYEKYIQRLNKNGGIKGDEIKFEWFDFHNVCKGMKFENVALLIGTLESTLRSFGWTVEQQKSEIKQQSGVLRTNCMDCLDRTNVVQSALGGWALQQQLSELGLNIDLKRDPKTQWFNSLWADNGDAISKQYAGTAALKGDFTRTRKRNWAGAITDLSLTMNRYYNNIFSDYFMQTCLDYYLGKAGPEIFDEFETNMMSKDYAFDVQQVRQSAIDTSIKIVADDPNEANISGWTLSCPHEANTFRTVPFEECVVLLTGTSLYFCRFDWKTEKVSSFERIDLVSIVEIWRGAYITSSLGPTNLDERKNNGFAIRYEITNNALIRRNTRTLQNEGAVENEEESKKSQGDKQSDATNRETRFLAFKALPPISTMEKLETDHNASRDGTESVKLVCVTIRNAIQTALNGEAGIDGENVAVAPEIQEKDLVSVGDAQKSTRYVESIGYSLKKLVWS